MFNRIANIISGDPVQRQLDSYKEIVDQISDLEPVMQALSDEALQGKTDEFRDRLAKGDTLEAILPEAFAVVREAAVRTIGMRHFDVQMLGGIILHEGTIVEMKTGEGKTLVATLPIYLNALQGEGVHLVTVNDYLARRDARWMGPIFHFLGLNVGVLQEAARTEHGRKAFVFNPQTEATKEELDRLDMVDRAQAYAADVTYGTNNEFGFDYLRDNMARTLDRRVQRGHHYAILDEVDNILIDEARTPLIISGPSHDDPELYIQMARVVDQLKAEDYEVNEKDRTVVLTEIGEDHVEQLLNTPLRDPDRPEDISPEQARLLGHLEQALRANHLFKRNKQYVVQGGRVIIVDEFTGRMMPGRRWSDGLHQAVEAKEGVKVRQENVTYATITLQNYFRMYEKLAGMTGTAVTEAEEFSKIYSVDVLPLPTNLEYIAEQPESDLKEVDYQEDGNKFAYYSRSDDPEEGPVFWRRKDYPDVVYRTEEAKMRSVAMEILRRNVLGQPLLVGTTSVELSERLSERLRAEMLSRLMTVQILRDAYLEAHGIPDDGMRIDEVEFLNTPLTELKQGELRSMARELEISLNPTHEANLARLIRILELEPDDAEVVVERLQSGIRHSVLNAKKHDEESAIIAGAGALGGVTIATNMAGRGVDIKLGGELAEEVLAAVNRVLRRTGIENPEVLSLSEREEALKVADRDAIGIYQAEVNLFRQHLEEERQVRQVGGLHVIGSERHESRRIDNQLRGRAARQGDPGSSQFFLSLEDELMRLFAGQQVSNLMQRLKIDDAIPLAHNLVNRTIEQAQTRVEGAHFDTRKHLLEYDDVLNQQREVFYAQRNRVFAKDDLSQDIEAMLLSEVERHVEAASLDPDGKWKLLAWMEETQPTLNLESQQPYPSYMLRLLLNELSGVQQPGEVKGALLDIARRSLDAQGQHLRRSLDESLERALERLDDQVQSRIEMADMAIEGAIIEAEEFGQPVDPQVLMQIVEQAAGLRLQMDSESLERLKQDPRQFRRRLPDLVEGSMGLRVWAGLVQTVERRLGQSLELSNKMQIPMDWDEAETTLKSAYETKWGDRTENLLEDIERDLDNNLGSEALDEKTKLQHLVKMSYGQVSFFDRKTHQRRSAMVARMSYTFASADLVTMEGEELTADLIEHLDGAREAVQFALGWSELTRAAGQTLQDLDESEQSTFERALGDETFEEYAAKGPIADWSESEQKEVAQLVGSVILSRVYRDLILSVGDRAWVDYLTSMEALRTSIGLEAYGQRDPLVQYKSRAFDMFSQLLVDIRAGVVSRMFRFRSAVQPQAVPATADAAGAAPPAKSGSRKSKRRRRRR